MFGLSVSLQGFSRTTAQPHSHAAVDRHPLQQVGDHEGGVGVVDGAAHQNRHGHVRAERDTSGPEWSARMKRLAQRAPDLDLFGQKLVERNAGQWIITPEGRTFLADLERGAVSVAEQVLPHQSAEHPPADERPQLPVVARTGINNRRRRQRKQRRMREDRSA
jgi:hypothetical protein